MGYSAHYSGEFKFAQEVNSKALAKIMPYLGGRCDLRTREELDSVRHPDLFYVDLKLNDTLDGLVPTNGDGSFYCADMKHAVALITDLVREVVPEFKLSGMLDAVGEDGARWRIRIGDDGVARDVKMKFVEVEE